MRIIIFDFVGVVHAERPEGYRQLVRLCVGHASTEAWLRVGAK